MRRIRTLRSELPDPACMSVIAARVARTCGINSGKIKPTGNLYAGFDPGGLVDPAAIMVVQKNSGPANNKKVFRVVLKKTFYVERKNRENGKLPDEIYTKFTVQVSDYHKELHFQSLIVDSTGIGRPIAG